MGGYLIGFVLTVDIMETVIIPEESGLEKVMVDGVRGENGSICIIKV